MKYFFPLFIISFIILLLPSIDLAFIFSHQIAKICILIIFTYLFFSNKIIFHRIHRNVLIVFLLFIFAQGLSVIGSNDVNSFISRFEDIFFTSLLFFSSIALHNQLRNKYIFTIFYSLIFITVINSIFQLIIYFFPSFFITFLSTIISSGYVNLITMNIERNRVYFDAYDEITIPILFYVITKKNYPAVTTSILLIITTSIISVISLLTNFRTKLVMITVSILSSFITFIPKFKKTAILLLLFFCITITIVYSFASSQLHRTIFSRIQLEDYTEDVKTLSSRLEQGQKALEIITSNPFLGIGLGNYYLYENSYNAFTIPDKNTRNIILDSQLPHNYILILIVESGLITGTLFLLLLFIFAKNDLYIFTNNGDLLHKTIVISFWTLFIYSQFNPSIGITYQTLFWTLRSILFIDYSNEETTKSLKTA